MPLFGPDPMSMWATSRPLLRRLLLATLAFAVALALAPAARAQEAPPAVTEQPPVPAADQPVESGPPPDPVPVVPDPAPAPEPPAPAPEPTPELQVPEPPAAQPADDQGQPASRPAAEEDRNAGTHSVAPAPELPGPDLSTISQAPLVAAPAPAPDATTAPLGWDVYDDALFAETMDGGVAGGFGGGVPPSLGGFGGIGTIASAAQRTRQHHAKPTSRPEAMVPGGSGNGGTGPGNSTSLGLFGAAGGTGAGMALMTLLGMACAWFLLAPDRLRAFLTSTATWRLSAYVPPIEHPG